MAAQQENLLSFGNLSSAERNTLRQHVLTQRPVLLQAGFSTPRSHQDIKTMKLQQQWQELKERELTAKKHNRQLLQQFEEAQDRLREMLTLNATMKTIRKEYERYLEENSPRWEQQLKEQTQAAHRRRMGECLRSCQKHTDRISKSAPDQPSLSQGLTEKTHNITASQSYNNQNNFSDYNQDDSIHVPFMPSSWLSHPQSQTSRFPIRAPYQPQPSSHAPQPVPPPPFFLQPPPFPLPNLASTLAPDWGSLLPHHLWPLTPGVAGEPRDSGALCGLLHMEKHPPERIEAFAMKEGPGTSRSSSSQRGGSVGSRRSNLSQELDIKPVRLSSGHAESSESSRDPDQATQERRRKKKRDKRERSQSSSSGRDAPSSQGSSGTSTAIIFAPATVAQSAESDASSKRSSSRRSRRSGTLAVVSPKLEMGMKEGSKRRANNKEEGQSTGDEVESPNEEYKSDKSGNPEFGSQRGDESGNVSVKTEDSSGDETERDESRGSGRKSVAEKTEEEEEPEREQGDGDGENDAEKGNSKINEEHEERDEEDEEDNEASDKKNTSEDDDETGAEDDDDETGTEDEDGTGSEDEMEEQELVKGEEIPKKGDTEMRKQDTEDADENGSEGGEDETEAGGESDKEERGESGEEKEQTSDEAGEPEQEGDSEDSIIAPQDNRAKKIYVIPETTEYEEEEKEEGSGTGSSDDDLNGSSDEDIENLLAPQDQSQKKEEKEKSAGQKPKATCDTVEMFQVQQCTSTKENLSDSDEFDHFYD